MILWGLWIFKRQNMVIINDILLQLRFHAVLHPKERMAPQPANPRVGSG